VGAIEQHGPHLPLDTDVILAEGVAKRVVAMWGEAYDVWLLPTMPIGMSREHNWAPGTLSLSIMGFCAYLREWMSEIVRSLPARNVIIVNGHGGNRGVLETLLQEFREDYELNVCVTNPSALSKVKSGSNLPEVHGGKSETSMILELAPQAVRLERMAALKHLPDKEAISSFIIERGTSWAWTTDDGRIADTGIIGDARAATRELGQQIVASALEEYGRVLTQLKENGRRLRSSHPSGSPVE
jgi:creatinine amidohydrolase/Fe(II)-dependent formamide hydrolase-like protein